MLCYVTWEPKVLMRRGWEEALTIVRGQDHDFVDVVPHKPLILTVQDSCGSDLPTGRVHRQPPSWVSQDVVAGEEKSGRVTDGILRILVLSFKASSCQLADGVLGRRAPEQDHGESAPYP